MKAIQINQYPKHSFDQATGTRSVKIIKVFKVAGTPAELDAYVDSLDEDGAHNLRYENEDGTGAPLMFVQDQRFANSYDMEQSQSTGRFYMVTPVEDELLALASASDAMSQAMFPIKLQQAMANASAPVIAKRSAPETVAEVATPAVAGDDSNLL